MRLSLIPTKHIFILFEKCFIFEKKNSRNLRRLAELRGGQKITGELTRVVIKTNITFIFRKNYNPQNLSQILFELRLFLLKSFGKISMILFASLASCVANVEPFS